MEFPAFSLKDGDSVLTWNSRKLKGKLPPGTWNQKETSVFCILISDDLVSLEIKH